MLAAEHGCTVDGVDLTPDFIEVAIQLTRMTKLEDKCAFHVGSVLETPFDDNAFDAAVTFHVAMNIVDRAAFYGELARVLRPGSPLCVFDVMKGPAPGMEYPVPWADREETSFLKSAEETKALLKDAGFTIEQEENLRDYAIDYFHKVFAAAEKQNGPPPLGLHLLTGRTSPEKFSNYLKAAKAHQIEPVIIVASRR